MNFKRDIFVLAAAALGAGILIFYWRVSHTPAPVAVAVEEVAPPPIDAPFITFVDPSKGPKDAAVTIVEFGDYACPHCRSSQQAIDRLIDAYPGQVRFIWKSAPSPLHQGADVAAAGALCAAQQGMFWEFHDRLFKDAVFLNEASMVIQAGELRLDSEAFGACLSSRATQPLIERTVTEAKALRLTGIPTIFVNGQRFDGALTYEQLLEATGL